MKHKLAGQTSAHQELILRQANPEQYLTSLSRHAPHWGSSLSTEQYFEREEILSSTRACRDGRFQCWVLVPSSSPDSLNFFCSCETIKREVICVIGPNPNHPTVYPAYSICSVFCPTQNRGQGYARQMMRLLHSELGYFQSSKSSLIPTSPSDTSTHPILSFLYSDVGPDFYAKAGPPGWYVKESMETVWVLNENLCRMASQFSESELEPIYTTDFTKVAEIDRNWLHEQLCKPSKGGQKVRFSVQPSGAELEWLVNRSKIHARFLKASKLPNLPVVEIWGYQMKESLSEFVTWYIDYPAQTFYLTRVKCQPNNQVFLKSVFKKIIKLAGQQNCHKIKCWNLDPILIAGLDLPSQTQQRTDSLSAVAWYGETVDDIEWINNEKLFWC
ncbi:hypothetical protein CROQUDRAFT_719522 [Cronartium quercuum f. sp. fusiforme G11]|uniref:LYC1 C-terminal domain-containing protein n=1 Tax=Cronartium quercuum f. sp. fusiforme G11 TaxID=708437 RepID=A0A9P6NTX3_9BASI|nr:hypothetical protein CROQUDRAFT_719522 [Cronartium quercuum f. sp. fusiforme G11]